MQSLFDLSKTFTLAMGLSYLCLLFVNILEKSFCWWETLLKDCFIGENSVPGSQWGLIFDIPR